MILSGDLSKAGKYIDLGEQVSGFDQTGTVQTQLFANFQEKAIFELKATLLGAEDTVFKLFQFRCDETFGVD